MRGDVSPSSTSAASWIGGGEGGEDDDVRRCEISSLLTSHLLPQFRNVEAGVHSTGHGCLADGAA